MLGAIYGDKAGSIYEFKQFSKISPIYADELILPNSFYSDDTIETIAIIDAIINKKNYGETLKKYILEYETYKPNFSPYFKNSFSPSTIQWAHGNGRNDSLGNGALMRISPVGFLFETEEEVVNNALLATIPTHNSLEAIESATIIALMIFYFRKGLCRDEIYKKLNLDIKYTPFTKFNTTCSETIGNCLFAIYKSTSFDDAIRKVLVMGGDTDTNACIVGSIAEAMYGMNDNQKVLAKRGLPDNFTKIIKKIYK